jgi:hypothetical protein
MSLAYLAVIVPLILGALTTSSVEELKEKASQFIEERERSWGSAYSAEIEKYILNVIEDRSFQDDPDLYMLEWDKRRGFTKEFRLAEDSARAFFKAEFHSCK